MANKEQLAILKQGEEVWNEWRNEHPDIRPDLSYANLSGVDLYNVNLSNAELSGANLSNAGLDFANLSSADLSSANLSSANLIAADLIHADLSSANLSGARLGGTHLSHANLSHANLSHAHLDDADLSHANLSYAHLDDADLSEANLKDADLNEAIVGWTRFGDVDLSVVKNLETVNHDGPSTIGIDTIYLSHGNISEVFLRKAGVQESFLTNMHALVDSMQPVDFYSCFISYSSKDQDFAERLYADLLANGVRCWRDKENLKIGEKFRISIEKAIRRHDKLLLVLSQHSVKSKWVETEVETAFEKERRSKKLVLLPIRLDEAVIRTRQAWAADIRRQRQIGDFTRWKHDDDYEKVFTCLLRDLKSGSV